MEVLLILARLAVLGRITFHTAGPSLHLPDVFELLQNNRQRSKVSVMRKRRTEEAVLKAARELSKDLFSTLGPDNEKELFAFYREHFGAWLNNLRSYQSKADVGQFPGKALIRSIILLIERLLSNDDSFDFFKTLTEKKNDYLDAEEDYRDIHHFYSKQMSSWQQMLIALRRFQPNAQSLNKDANTAKALAELEGIAKDESPYGHVQKIVGLIETIDTANNALLYEKRSHAIGRLDEKIIRLQHEIESSGVATPDLSNRLLLPLQQIKKQLADETSVAQIYMLQTQVADEKLDDALLQLDRAMQHERERQKKLAAAPGTPGQTGETKVQVVAEPKPVAEVSASALLG
ncbi:MAG: BREX system P-loop protein BrxC, partial [Pseudohongiella sp.]|nr:BREX system P-loop protein BrxC [Pseudohongiella sp.]